MDRDLKCDICNNAYDLENRSPICIPCGHTLCIMCLKDNYEKEGKVKCASDNKVFNLRPEQYAKNHFILKLLQSKKTVITNININKNINLVNNNNINLTNNSSSNKIENISNQSLAKELNKANLNNFTSTVNNTNKNLINNTKNLLLRLHNNQSRRVVKLFIIKKTF